MHKKDSFSDLWKTVPKGPENLVLTLAFVFEQIMYPLPPYASVYSGLDYIVGFFFANIWCVCASGGSQEDFRWYSNSYFLF